MVYKSKYQDIVDNIIFLTKDIYPQDYLEKFKAHIEEKLNNFKPTIMVYGTYNAGKSSLINAIFGKKLAKTGDAPETSKIYSYNFEGYTIYDTPGINAPIEHEKVTQQHLKKCDIVIFVLSNDGALEEEYIYKKIAEIIKMEKPLLIVLNNKRGINIDSEEAIKEINKINKNLSKIGVIENIKDIEEKTSLVYVDLLTAFEGKMEKEEELIKESNILQLENKIREVLSITKEKDIIKSLNFYIRDFIDNVLMELDKKIDDENIREIEESITYLERLKSSFEIKLKNLVNRELSLLKQELINLLMHRASQAEINTCLENFINNIENKIKSELSNQLKEFNENVINIKSDNYLVETPTEVIEIDEIKKDNLSPVIIRHLKNRELVTNVTKQIFLKLREYKILFKGKWEKTLGAYAGKVAIVVNVLISAYEVYSAYKEYQQTIEREKTFKLSIYNKTEEIVNDIKNELFANIDLLIDELFLSKINDLRKEYRSLNEENKKLLNLKFKLENIKESLKD